MAENISNSLKFIRKLKRKNARAQQIIERDSGITCTNEPTLHLAICNVGLSNGLTETCLVDTFSVFGKLNQISLVPNKSYCFVSFDCIESSIKAFTELNGKCKIGQNESPIYLTYMHEIPLFEKACFQEPYPPGLTLREEFISEIEENKLLQLVDWGQIDSSEALLKHRTAKHYGYEFLYTINNVHKDSPLEEKIPDECSFILQRFKEIGICIEFDQLTVNKYEAGQGIPPHIDTHSAFEDTILSLSLGSPVVMDFKRGRAHVPILLPKRSLLIMSGESRYAWSHGIIPRKYDTINSPNGYTTLERGTRISFTFRKILRRECRCNFEDYCDLKKIQPQITKELADDLEKTHVHQVYDEIAEHFNETRHKPWPNVVTFLESFSLGSILVDVGCGNGKYLGISRKLLEVGCDMSLGLLKHCRNKSSEAFCCNCLHLPIVDGIADGVISIAVIHHLATEERRLRAIQEMVRICCIGGKILIYIWAKEQQKDTEKSSYLKQDRKNRSNKDSVDTKICSENSYIFENKVTIPVHINRTDFRHQDMMVPWKTKQSKENTERKEFLRFYHVFQDKELENLAGKIKNVNILKSYYDQGNWCIVLEKIK